MYIPKGRLRTFAVLGTLTTLAFSSVQAGQFGGSENQLVGITLRTSTFRDVLRKYGQPDEIQGGGPFLPTAPKSVVASVTGGGGSAFGRGGRGGGMPETVPTSGGPSSGGGPRGGGGNTGKRTTSKFGFPGESDGDTGSGGSAPGSGGRSGGYPGSPNSGGGSGGYPGSPDGGGKSGGLPGFPGGGNSGGGYPGTGGPGGPGGPGSSGIPGSGETGDGVDTELPITEATWWYHNPRKGYHMSFLFNKDGRVIQIQEYGWQTLHSGKTRHGIMLGSNMTQVLSKYGWSNDGAHSGDNVTMRYGGSNKVAFQMVHNRVLGITVAVGQ